MPGDAIVAAGDAKTEGFNWDLTVDALGSLPAAPAPARIKVSRHTEVNIEMETAYPLQEPSTRSINAPLV